MQTKLQKARPAMAGFFVCATLLLTGCMIRFQDIRPIPSQKDYAAATCAQLEAEKQRVERDFRPFIKSHRHGTSEGVAILKGEAIAIDAAAHEKGCENAPVEVPYNKPLHVK